MIIRPAAPEDAGQVIPLLYDAIGSIAYVLTGTDNPASAIHAMSEWYKQRNNRLSYENVLVAEEDGEAVGAALFYHGSRIAELDQPLLDRLAARKGIVLASFPAESRENEFYLDSLAVNPACRGQGIGTRLMQVFEAAAARQQYDRVALIVSSDNPRARKLYMSQGYVSDGQIDIAGADYDHMVKRL